MFPGCAPGSVGGGGPGGGPRRPLSILVPLVWLRWALLGVSGAGQGRARWRGEAEPFCRPGGGRSGARQAPGWWEEGEAAGPRAGGGEGGRSGSRSLPLTV